MQSDTTVVSIASVFFEKAAIIIATHGRKTLRWLENRIVKIGDILIYFYVIEEHNIRNHRY